jgi:hypothetical protein
MAASLAEVLVRFGRQTLALHMLSSVCLRAGVARHRGVPHAAAGRPALALPGVRDRAVALALVPYGERSVAGS